MSRAAQTCRAGKPSADHLHGIIARLASAGSGIVMVAPGYSRGELLADLRAIEVMLRSSRGADPPDQNSAGEDP